MPAAARGIGMHDALTGADRKLLAGAAALLVLLIAWTALVSPRRYGDGSAAPSIYSRGKGGARAAYLLLGKLGYEVTAWEESPAGLGDAGGGALMVLAEPTETPSNVEKRALRAFVARGGRVLFCGKTIRRFFTRADSQELAGGEARTWRIGKGEVIWWAAATPLTNGAIGREQNLERLLATTTTAGSNERLKIYWDEYFHGQRGSLWSYVARTPAAWGIAQAGLLVLGALLTFGRRSGPVVAPAEMSRLSPLEFVNTLGSLYERARAAPIAVDVAYRSLRLKLVRQLGLPATAVDGEVAQAAGDRLGWDAKNLAAALDEAKALRKRKLRAADALEMVKRLAEYTRRLAGSNAAAPRGTAAAKEM